MSNLMLQLSLLLIIQGCAKAQFRRQANNSNQDLPAPLFRQDIYISSKEEGELSKSIQIVSGNINLKVDEKIGFNTSGEVINKPVSIYFALDRSTSMNLYLEEIKKGVNQFSQSLVEAGFEVKYGALTFRDPIDQVFSLNTYEEFKKFIDSIDTREVAGDANTDITEGSLAAISEANRRLIAEDNRNNSERVIVLITDTVGHRGGSSFEPSPRNCDPTEVVNQLSSSQSINTKLYYSVSPVPYQIGCSGFQQGNIQIDSILKDITVKSTGNYRGQSLSWPFSSNTLNSELSPILQTKLSPKEASCRISGLTLLNQNNKIASWRLDELNIDNSGIVTIQNALSKESIEKLIGQPIELEVSRCCQMTENQCTDQKVQKVKFTLSY